MITFHIYDRIEKTTERVGSLKPYGRPLLCTGDPRVVAGVISWLLEVGAKQVIVCEESSISTHVGRHSNTHEALEHTGYRALIDSFGSPRVRLALMRDEGTVTKTVEGGLCLREVEYPKLLAEAERLINVPILKFHLQTLLTNAVKNTWCGAPQLQRATNHCWGLASAMLDIHSIRPPDLTLVDALQPLTRDHSYGDPLDWRLVMAGRDSIALDALGAWMLGFDDPMEIETVKLGSKAGLGEARQDGLVANDDRASWTAARSRTWRPRWPSFARAGWR